MIATDSIATSKVVLALGGGGARGLAHFGAMQAVSEAGLQIERIVGTSIGSLAGAMVATGESPDAVAGQVLAYLASSRFTAKQGALFGVHSKVDSRTRRRKPKNPQQDSQSDRSERFLKRAPKRDSGMLVWYDRVKDYLWARKLLGRVYRRRSILTGKVLEKVISELIPDIDIRDTHVALSIVAVDLRSGRQVVLEHGSLRKAITASAAIPGIFPPVEWEGMLLCDVGVLESLPTQIARSYLAGQVVGIDVSPTMSRVEDCESALHVLLRMDEIGERLNRGHSQALADILIRPEVGHCQWFDFSQAEVLVQAGLSAGRMAIGAWKHRRSSSRMHDAYAVSCPRQFAHGQTARI